MRNLKKLSLFSFTNCTVNSYTVPLVDLLSLFGFSTFSTVKDFGLFEYFLSKHVLKIFEVIGSLGMRQVDINFEYHIKMSYFKGTIS